MGVVALRTRSWTGTDHKAPDRRIRRAAALGTLTRRERTAQTPDFDLRAHAPRTLRPRIPASWTLSPVLRSLLSGAAQSWTGTAPHELGRALPSWTAGTPIVERHRFPMRCVPQFRPWSAFWHTVAEPTGRCRVRQRPADPHGARHTKAPSLLGSALTLARGARGGTSRS